MVLLKAPVLLLAPKEYKQADFDQAFRVIAGYFARVDALQGLQTTLTAQSSTNTYTGTLVQVSPYTDGLVLVDTTAGNTVVLLPAPVLCPGQEFIVKRITAGGNTLTIKAENSALLDGGGSTTIPTQYAVKRLRSDGAAYWIV